MSSIVARPLPSRPDLEFERKRAKKLLVQLRQGDPDALTRASAANRSLSTTPPDAFKLADAQLTIAREYGFRSWPLLVEYFTTLARHQRSPLLGTQEQGVHKWWPQTLVAEHRDRREWTGQMLATFVPRFYGSSVEEVLNSPITLADAQLVTARQHGAASWDELLEKVAKREPDHWADPLGALKRASKAIYADDLALLQQVVTEHPELLTAEVPLQPMTNALVSSALGNERKKQTPEACAVTEWVRSLGIDFQPTLNRKLLGHKYSSADTIAYYLSIGADPAWVAPNGISILEHAIYRYWNGAAVDVIASRVKPREALWIAAGLGDISSMRRYFDRSGKLRPAARRHRPDFTAMDDRGTASLADPDDHTVLWEAFYIAATNQRFEAMDFLLEHGYPIDYGPGMTMLSFGVGNSMLPLVEFLISRGASVDIRGWRPAMTAREMAEENYKNEQPLPDALRILHLCGGRDPGLLVKEVDEKLADTQPVQHLIKVHGAAKADAVRCGQTAVEIENMFIGMLQESTGTVLGLLADAGVELGGLRAMLQERLTPPSDAVTSEIPNSAALNAVIHAAAADARQRRTRYLTTTDVLGFMLMTGIGPVANIIRQAGGTPEGVQRILARLGRPVDTSDG